MSWRFICLRDKATFLNSFPLISCQFKIKKNKQKKKVWSSSITDMKLGLAWYQYRIWWFINQADDFFPDMSYVSLFIRYERK